MTQTARWIEDRQPKVSMIHRTKRLSSLRFLVRYPIFLLWLGPPQFKIKEVGVDTSQAHLAFWNVFAVSWLLIVALRAAYRLIFSKSIRIPNRIRSILRYSLFLGLLFASSVIFSAGRAVSAQMTVLYFLNFICLVEFVVDVYASPPNWVQCIFEIRFLSLLLAGLVVACLPLFPQFVMSVVEGHGVRLMGGGVGTMPAICPIIAIISAYAFMHKLESRIRSFFFFAVGVTLTFLTQVRGAEIALFIVLLAVGLGRAKSSKQFAYKFIAGSVVFILLGSSVMVLVGGRIWDAFNRGQRSADILTASGRTENWADLIRYTVSHPQGLGYISGIRTKNFGHGAAHLHSDLTNIGGTDNSYFQVLSDVGWFSLMLYLAFIFKIVSLGVHLARQDIVAISLQERLNRSAMQCALFLLMFCLLEGMEGSDFVIPLRQEFYFQNVIIATILGISTTILVSSRAKAQARAL